MPEELADRYIEYQGVETIVPADRNPKAHVLDDIEASMRRFGYTEPIMVDERTGRLISGHGRIEVLQAAHAKGMAPPAGVRVADDGHWQVPVVRGWASRDDEEAKAYLIAANQLTVKGGWDRDPLAALLGELAEMPDGLVGVGFDESDLDLLLAELAVENAHYVLDPKAEWEGMPDYESENLKSKVRVVVHFTSEDDYRAFLVHCGNPRVRQNSFWWPTDDGHLGCDATHAYAHDDGDPDSDPDSDGA